MFYVSRSIFHLSSFLFLLLLLHILLGRSELDSHMEPSSHHHADLIMYYQILPGSSSTFYSNTPMQSEVLLQRKI